MTPTATLIARKRRLQLFAGFAAGQLARRSCCTTLIPKSRGGRDTVPMHSICQQTLTANFTNSELQRHGMNVDGLLADPSIRKFVDWVAKKDPDFTATITKKQR